VRDFWRGERSSLGEFASRISGSADLYEHSGRRPVASINFVTAHDGFTMRDLVSYNEKHNEANGEDNNDGESHNRSWNCGVEGPTDDPEVLAIRARQQRNFIATLMLSQGVPMLCHGDELGRTQNGNNNGYAQDSELTWIDWEKADTPLLEFTAAVAKLRAEHPTFRRRRFFDGRQVEVEDGADLPDILWFGTDGKSMSAEAWNANTPASVGMFLNGYGIRSTDFRGQPISDKNFLLYFNGHFEDVDITIPSEKFAKGWDIVVDTAGTSADSQVLAAGSTFKIIARSMIVLREHEDVEVDTDHSVAASLAAMAGSVSQKSETMS